MIRLSAQHPHLYVIPTPIGNMEDITLRALSVLKKVDWLLCEDTRRSLQLLRHYDIHVPKLERFDMHTEYRSRHRLIDRFKAGEQGGLVCDAGTPGISDACYSLVSAMQKEGLSVCCLPGATALIPALVCSGLPTTSFYFEGFLPHKKKRKQKLEALQARGSTSVLYESPHRLLKTLREMAEVFGREADLAISREISKWHEETLRGSISTLITHFEAHKPKGEFVLVCPPSTKSDKQSVLTEVPAFRLVVIYK